MPTLERSPDTAYTSGPRAGIAKYDQATETVDREKEIAREVDALHRVAQENRDLTDRLLEKLGPVLRQIPEKPVGANPTPNCSTDLGRLLSEASQRIHNTSDLIRVALTRLEL